ncbi:histidinol-phosphate transaminase [Muricomes intestini]|jgi:histidinol-phosphate aminotransferase|uniref:Histidinol-phosphate aminotransferase n=1 Tax=Muricomes intestini TaxID=1796634 RepID=A0A4R3K1S8_9FIRM|nr:histidinol-phosphate transaminase [Muricomes intestini]TCS75788.1 histidinol-phosphate aminotransferase [Muricomes intestini]HCR82981.1 histidinol-phosphate transaminase [Lachnospiraceae bacterium]
MEINENLLKNIRKVEPYVPGEQPQNKVVKLNTNENPYPPAPGVQKALRELEYDRFRLYPDPTAKNLVDILAKYYHVGNDQVFVGVGSDDVLAMCFLTFFNSEKPVLFPDITYSFYKVWAGLYGIPYECPKLDGDFRIQREDYYRDNGGIIFPNPNAPTAIYEELEFIEDILRHNQDVIVIVDEAYIDFAGRSALELLAKYQNLIVVQTFSKARSMAGMRIGYAIGDPELVKCLNDVKYSFNSYTLNLPSLICGAEAVKDREYFEKVISEIVDTREWTKKELRGLGFEFPDAKANFIFAAHPDYNGEELFQALKRENIYVRHWNSERIGQYLRISIGTKEEMGILFDSLKRYISKQGDYNL